MASACPDLECLEETVTEGSAAKLENFESRFWGVFKHEPAHPHALGVLWLQAPEATSARVKSLRMLTSSKEYRSSAVRRPIMMSLGEF